MPNTNIKRQLGNSIRALRNRLGISQEELAGRAGLHRTYLSDVERGARNVSLESMEKLALALEISVSTLLSHLSGDAIGPSDSHILKSLPEILFVEDNPQDVEITLRALKKAGISNPIHPVSDGAEALDFLFCTGEYANRSSRERPQIILLDLSLPKISGFEVLRRVKADLRTRNIPVVVLTASRNDRDIAMSKRLGADAYVLKPVDFQNLSQVMPQLSFQWALWKPAKSVHL